MSSEERISDQLRKSSGHTRRPVPTGNRPATRPRWTGGEVLRVRDGDRAIPLPLEFIDANAATGRFVVGRDGYIDG